jgi:4-carboxymuconolactone decarboxylase
MEPRHRDEAISLSAEINDERRGPRYAFAYDEIVNGRMVSLNMEVPRDKIAWMQDTMIRAEQQEKPVDIDRSSTPACATRRWNWSAGGERNGRKGDIMDEATYERGLAKRRKVLGEDYVNRALASADDFNRDFQRIVTQYCWGEAWGDETLTPRERSILNLGMIAALGKMEEFQTHVRGALGNGLTPNEVRAVLTQIAVYCGVPVGVDCFRVAKPIVDAHRKK